jgi:hypothetical protein
MNRFANVPVLALLALLSAACSSSSSGTGGDGGSASGASDGTTLSCLVQLGSFDLQCQYYEATGADAVKTISQLRAGCIDQAGAKASVVDACPTDGALGGCKTPVTVKGSTQVQLFITNFEYKPVGDAGGLASHSTPEQVKSFCASQGASATYVPAR